MNNHPMSHFLFGRLAWLTTVWALCASSAAAQLAITEVMSSASTNHGASYVANQSDFWELTNFGSTAIDVTDYTFADSLETPRQPLVALGDPRLVLAPRESVVFVRTKETTTVEQFREWWGERLPSWVEVRMVSTTPGFNSLTDGLRVWDQALNLVDRVDFGVSRRGVSFVSDPVTGEFGAFSEAGVDGAGKAATADDVGSPGAAVGPLPLQIVSQPKNQVVCAGTDPAFEIRATGLPRPKFQWYFNGSAIPGATGARYVITNVQPAQVGPYQVVVSNGLELVLSASVTVAVTMDRSAPSIVTAPLDVEVYSNQTAQLSVEACAFPIASYQWFYDGVPMDGETKAVLALPSCTPAMSGAEICVRVSNELGFQTACAHLQVTPKPKLRLTEVMANGGPDCVQGADWVEVTNFDTRDVNLRGYRFSDRYSLVGAFEIKQPVVLAPGQSVILTEGLNADQFARWWGAGNLPPNLVVISYYGLGLGTNDAFYLWNGAADDPEDSVDYRSWAGMLPGVSQLFTSQDEDCFFGCDSVVGEAGAFRAECGGIGSPGYTTNPPPRLVTITRDALQTRLQWHGVEGRTYRVEYTDRLQTPHSGAWLSLGEVVATDSLPTKRDTNPNSSGRFYRVLEVNR